MPAVPIIPDSAPFSQEQRAWLNGFLAGVLSNSQAMGAASIPSAESKRPLLIAYGSQSGNAECFAKKLGKDAAGRGFAAQVSSLESLQTADLVKSQNLLLVTSTWGEGDMPDNAANFWDHLNQNGSSPQLTGVKYSVLALGDKNYADTFCLAGRKIDERLEQLGAQRVHPRVDCDVEFDEPASEWSDAALVALLGGDAGMAKLETVSQALPDSDAPNSFSKKNPFPARLLANIRLNSERSSKDTRHFAFSLAGSGLSYETGDALGVRVQNDPEVVSSVIAAHQLDADAPVKLPDGTQAPLQEALAGHYEIRSLLGVRPDKAPAPDEFIDSLKKLQPRLYSIASSLKAHPDEVHLCIAAVRYEKDGVRQQGVASTFLADRLAIGDMTGVFVHTAKHFRVPANGDTPIIMIGPGTGIAPFRAFLEERHVTGARGKNWLFFGDQKLDHDFLYRDEIQAWVKDGHLTRLDTAFSRDQEKKIYVQNRMLDAAAELWQWLEEGAHFFVCGDASRMAKDVDAVLHQVIATHGGKSTEDAASYVAEMKKSKRYARDVY